MNTNFIEAVRRIVERSNPPKMRASVSSTVRSSAGPLLRPTTVQGVSVSGQSADGGWQISWQSVPGAVGYEIQTNPDPGRVMRWFERGRVSDTGTEIRARTEAHRLWLRVRAFGQAGTGPWSDPGTFRSWSDKTSCLRQTELDYKGNRECVLDQFRVPGAIPPFLQEGILQIPAEPSGP